MSGSDGALWTWSVRVYDRPSVAAACLSLQDERGQSVPWLLWAAWAGRAGRLPDSAELTRLAAETRAWTELAVAPLRRVRREMKGAALLGGLVEPVRARVQAAELAAERLLLERLEAASPSSGRSAPYGAALVEAARAWNGRAPKMLAVLARLLCDVPSAACPERPSAASR